MVAKEEVREGKKGREEYAHEEEKRKARRKWRKRTYAIETKKVNKKLFYENKEIIEKL